MTANASLKSLARKSGLFGLARKVYRSISPAVRRHLSDDRALYGKFISRGDLVFDIGCNLGQKSVTFLRLGARVIALEPNPNCAPVLDLEFGDEQNFTLVRKAVGTAPGAATLNFANTHATASLRPDWHALVYSDGPLQQVVVDVTTLDDLIASYGEPDFCKIDVEGFEPEVVKGLSRPLKMLSLEYHRHEPERIIGCLEILQGLGPIRLNVIAMEGREFICDEWKSVDDFRAMLGGADLPTVGDVFVARRI